MTSRLLIGLALWLSCWQATADEIALNPNHPSSYVVVKGDTLWDISGRFLQKPWQWPEIWQQNPQIANPHWIYPGDVLTLTYVDGKPRLQVGRPSEMRLSPRVRVTPMADAIPTIPANVIQPFLARPKVVAPGELEQSPYILAFPDERITGGAGDRAYVRGMPDDGPGSYMVFRPGQPYLDAETKELLGYEALYVADAEKRADGDPATVYLTTGQREAFLSDRLLPNEPEKVLTHYEPHAPTNGLHGHIIGVVDGVTQIGQYQTVVIDRGTADGVETGHVLEIFESGRATRDITGYRFNEVVTLPDEKSGELMIVHPYERVSFGLVMKATRAIHVLDAVKQP